MIDDPEGGRLQLWRVRRPGPPRFACPELLEHVGRGEFAWLYRDGAGTVSWMIDDAPVTVLELLDLVSSLVADWVIGQTLAQLRPVLGRIAVLEPGDDGELPIGRAQQLADELDRDPDVAGVAELMDEFTRFSNAAHGLMEQLTRVFSAPGTGPSRAAA